MYQLAGDRRETNLDSEHFIFALWSSSNNTYEKKEAFIYPLSTLVAELGGTLGLFLGFSFLSLWDGLELLYMRVAAVMSNRVCGNTY
jgi:hypothetical protein